MKFDPAKHHRRSIRLQGYDYARAGAYFVTVVAQDRACLFGEVAGGVMRLNAAGEMVQGVWEGLPRFYPGVDVDVFGVMPNHVHGVVVLTGEGQGPGQAPSPLRYEGRQGPGQAQGPAPTMENGVGAAPRGRPGMGNDAHPGVLTLSDVVHRFKTLTTTRYIAGVKELGWPSFRGRVWQRNYYEQIIRNKAALAEIRRYIEMNPLGWDQDEENPQRVRG